MIETIFETVSPLGEPVRLYKNHWACEEESAETVSIVTGLHGDRLTGLYVATRLAAFLDRLLEGRLAGYRLTGRIQLFPVVHLRALEAGAAVWSFDNLDCDTAFPGTIEGEMTEKICNALLEHTAHSEYGLILQGAPRWHRDAPHLCLYHPDRPLRNLARTLGLGIARLLPDDPAYRLQLVKHWSDCGVQALIVATGGTPVLDRQTGDGLFEGILNFLLMTGLLSHPEEKGKKTEVAFYGPKGVQVVCAQQPGLFLAGQAVGTLIPPGGKLGEVRGLFDGKTLEEITAPQEGLLVTLRDYPLVYSGEPVAWLLTEKFPRWFWPFG